MIREGTKEESSVRTFTGLSQSLNILVPSPSYIESAPLTAPARVLGGTLDMGMLPGLRTLVIPNESLKSGPRITKASEIFPLL